MKVFLSKKEKRRYYRKLRIKFYLASGLLLLLGILSLYAVLSLPLFRISNFEISGNVKLEEARAEVLKNWLGKFLSFNNFLSWPNRLGDTVEIEKDFYKGVLKIKGNISEKFAIWCGQECYWVDRNGLVLEIAPDTEGSSIPKIKDSRGGVLSVNKLALAENLFANIVGVIDGLGMLPLRISGFEFNDRLQELKANGTRGERLIFSVRFTPPPKSFNYLRDLALSGQLRSSEYVDLTVENRIYLKPR